MLDYLIIGQGLAGSLLSHFLLKKGKTVAFVDNSHKEASSAIAAGIINPITGRRFVKSWRMDDFLPIALETYQELGEMLGIKIFHPKNAAMLFRDVETANNWLGRSAEPGLEGYVADDFDLKTYQNLFGDTVCAGVEFQNAGRCDLPGLIVAWKKLLIEQAVPYLEEPFDYEALQIETDAVSYKNIKAKRIIFCEGAAAMQNPYFNYLPFNPAKGEILLVRIPDYPINNKMAKDGIFIVPLDNGLYWVGSSYNRSFEDGKPSEVEKSNLIMELSVMLQHPFIVEQHLAAIRPTVRDRKPFLGQHPNFESLYIFNGLGAKGSYLGPYFARHFADYLEVGTSLEKDVNIVRCRKV